MISMHRLDPERQREALIPLENLSNAMVIEDTGALIDFLDRGEPVRAGGIGSIGYCMGGRHVLCVAGACPDVSLPEPACMARCWFATGTIPRIYSPTASEGSSISDLRNRPAFTARHVSA
jgi:dienelactone hydrolase family protein